MKILKTKKNKDKTTTIYYELNKRERLDIKRIYGWKRLTKERANKVILQALKEGIKRDTKELMEE